MTELDDWVKTLYTDEMTNIHILEYRMVIGNAQYKRHVVNPLDAIKWAEERQLTEDPKLEIKGDWTVEEVELFKKKWGAFAVMPPVRGAP